MTLLWFSILFIVLGFWGLYTIVSKGYDFITQAENKHFNKTLEECSATDKIIQQTYDPITDNHPIPQKLQNLLDNPLNYTYEQRTKIINQYKKLINGDYPDPKAINAPNEYDKEGDFINQDYITYLKNQLKHVGYNSWHYKELLRIEKIAEAEEIEFKFRSNLAHMGMPQILVYAAATPERIENYSTEDWKILINSLKEFTELYHPATIINFMENIHDKNILNNPDKMELFNLLINKNVPDKIAAIFVSANLSEEILEEILIKIEEDESPPEEAIKSILLKHQRKHEEQIARKEILDNLKNPCK